MKDRTLNCVSIVDLLSQRLNVMVIENVGSLRRYLILRVTFNRLLWNRYSSKEFRDKVQTTFNNCKQKISHGRLI